MCNHAELLLLLMLAVTRDPRVDGGRIIGGREAEPHSRPYMALLDVETKDGSKRCDGFLLNQDFVMTAAHCKGISYTVNLGVHNSKDKSTVQSLSVDKAFPHVDYHDNQVPNDIMLLKLSSKAVLNDYVRPIALPYNDSRSLPTSCSVSGWGRFERNKGFRATKLREINVTIVEDQRCADIKAFCSKGEAGPAMGDSGGPLVCEGGKAYGVVSHTYMPEPDTVPTHYYTMIPGNGDWIRLLMDKQ